MEHWTLPIQLITARRFAISVDGATTQIDLRDRICSTSGVDSSSVSQTQVIAADAELERLFDAESLLLQHLQIKFKLRTKVEDGLKLLRVLAMVRCLVLMPQQRRITRQKLWRK